MEEAPSGDAATSRTSTSTGALENEKSNQPKTFNLKLYKVSIHRLTEEEICTYLCIRDIGPLIKRCPVPKRGRKKRKKSVDEDYQPQPSTSGTGNAKKYPSANRAAVYASHKTPLKKEERELSWLNYYNKIKRIIKPHEKKGVRAFWESMTFRKQRKHIPKSPHDEILPLYRRRAQRPS